MKWYRLLQICNGVPEPVWTGKAYDEEHALEKAFYDESPGSLERYSLQRWSVPKLAQGDTKLGKWVTLWENQALAFT